MGALIFYTAIYFLGYYAAHLLNLMLGRTLIRNRRISGLLAVFMVSLVHGYKVISTTPPHDEEISHALGFYIILPVIVIVIAVAIRIWQESGDRDIP